MKKTNLLIAILFFISSIAYSQSIKDCDTIIKNEILTSYFSFKYKQPIVVSYKLYQGGGECSRTKEHLHFTNGGVIKSAQAKDYAGSGFDKGHLAPAEDFAFSCNKEKLTFFYYNALPQFPKLNRGYWKTYESKTRQLSQYDSVLVVCGGINYFNKLPNSDAYYPDLCFKVVQSLTTKKVLFVVIFENSRLDSIIYETTLDELEGQLKFKIKLKK